MLHSTRETVLRISNRLGLSDRVRDGSWRNNRLLILAYHGIALEDEHEWSPGLYMHASVFRQRMAILKRADYNVLPLDEALRRLRENTLPARCVTITFDDGFYDFHHSALPVLREFDYPATVYLTTYYCRENKPVFDLACSYVLWKAQRVIISGRGLTAGKENLDLRTGRGRLGALTEILTFAARCALSAAAKDELVARLAETVGVDYERIHTTRMLHLMKPEEVSRLAAHRIAVELHTHRHRTPRDRWAFLKEIEDNRASIREMTGKSSTPVHFCYPSGVHMRRFLPWLKDASIVSATTCEPGLAAPRANPLLLPRLLDSSSLSPLQFEGWLTGLGTFLPRRPAITYA